MGKVKKKEYYGEDKLNFVVALVHGRQARHIAGMDPIFRHLAACNNATLPGDRTPLLIGPDLIGYLDPLLRPGVLAAGGLERDDGIILDGSLLGSMSMAMAAAGHYRWRDEAFDVRATPDGPVLGTIIDVVFLEWLRVFGGYRMVIFGALIVAMMIWRPQGIMGRKEFDFGAMLGKLKR